MAIHLKGTIRYDGGPFSGWQIQSNARTVQGDLEAALAQIASEPVRVDGSARTDAGVHALGQVFSCAWPGDDVDLDGLRRSLCKMLSPHVRIEDLERAPEGFHARYSARAKRYAYTFSTARHPDPFSWRYSWRVAGSVEPGHLERLAQRFVGEHDFAGLQCAGASVKTTRRTVYEIALRPGGVVGPCDARDLCRLEFHGNGFLYKMVRNIVGVVVDVARGAIPESRIGELLASPGPYRGYTAPAEGLTLVEVIY